eukprot:1099474-Rhodomonas_salina.1
MVPCSAVAFRDVGTSRAVITESTMVPGGSVRRGLTPGLRSAPTTLVRQRLSVSMFVRLCLCASASVRVSVCTRCSCSLFSLSLPTHSPCSVRCSPCPSFSRPICTVLTGADICSHPTGRYAMPSTDITSAATRLHLRLHH